MKKVTLIPGDGIGKEISQATLEVLAAAKAPLDFDVVMAGQEAYEKEGAYLPQRLLDSLDESRLALKGPVMTPIGQGFSSINVQLRKKYDLYCNFRPIKAPGPLPLRYEGVNLAIFRENTEDLYAGLEEEVSPEEARSIKVITRQASQRIARAAYDYALRSGRKKVTIVTKANIMKKTDGLFLRACQEVAQDYPSIKTETLLVDNMAMQLVLHPETFDVILTENLYGDILSDLAAGLIGGLGLVPGANLGRDMAIFESVHGTAPDIAGRDMANPTAMLLSACLLLDHIDQKDLAQKIRRALYQVLSDKKNYTQDLGGSLGTRAFTKEVIQCLERMD
ncbi:MAG: isocitrate/isopropylmalate dehydrogenase family protein [Tissierellia bacterium]|nr:isocitrate/isopropylmalate dehydrogenase family protein [Tissierellia bacterium]